MSSAHTQPVPGPRGSRPTDARFRELLDEVRSYRPQDDLEPLRLAYEFSAREHGSQTRASGEPYLSHPLEVAHLLAGLRLDVTAVCVGLLHDVIEDTAADRKSVEQRFGPQVASLVESVTKLSRLRFPRSEAAQAENLRKMLLAMVDDVRVILIKLADRLHNMRTLEYLPEEKRERVARETLEIYAPIAHRLGMGRMRGELEDLAFLHLEPGACAHIGERLEERRAVDQRFLAEAQRELGRALKSGGVPGEVDGRIKRRYSIYQKMNRQGGNIEQIYDLLAVRVVTDTVKNCYAVLGVVHQLWQPVPGRFKDYVAMPRSNLYQALHTSLISPSGHPFEVQIRTREMHRMAEQGIASHWRYKDGEEATRDDDRRIAWTRSLIEWARETDDPSEFLSTLRVDLYPEEVYTFTPKGRVIALPRGATPIDFAYAIHTEVGHQCTGARIGGAPASLRQELENGDIVEILLREGGGPSRDWLTFVRTTRARNKIRQWIRAEQKTQARELGRRLLERDAARFQIDLQKVTEEEWSRVTGEFGRQRVEELWAGIAFGKFSTRAVLACIAPDRLPVKKPTAGPRRGRFRRTVEKMFRPRDRGVSLRERDTLMVRAGCCNPIPGEDVVGYITRGRGVAVHARHCPNVENLLYDIERRIEVDWVGTEEGVYPVRVTIRATDRAGLLAEVTGAISDRGSNIRSAAARTDRKNGQSVLDLIFTVGGNRNFTGILQALKRIPGVQSVERSLRV